jgi:hypothetical protein
VSAELMFNVGRDLDLERFLRLRRVALRHWRAFTDALLNEVQEIYAADGSQVVFQLQLTCAVGGYSYLATPAVFAAAAQSRRGVFVAVWGHLRLPSHRLGLCDDLESRREAAFEDVGGHLCAAHLDHIRQRSRVHRLERLGTRRLAVHSELNR